MAKVVRATNVPPSPTMPPSTIVQGASSSKKKTTIRGWTKQYMLGAIDDVEFHRYSIRVASKKHGISPTSIHY